MVFMKRNLETNTDRAVRANTEHAVAQADDTCSVLEAPECSDKLLCILFLLLYFILRETN